MPYRRLPNTDSARIKALKTAINKCSETDFNDVVVSFPPSHLLLIGNEFLQDNIFE